MLQRLIGSATPVGTLKAGLDASSLQIRAIGHRVANATTPDGAEGFDAALQEAQAGTNAREIVDSRLDLEREMVGLADEQLRFEASARLLQKVYQQVRASMRER
jgi:flagellar basal body rod protein FlgB